MWFFVILLIALSFCQMLVNLMLASRARWVVGYAMAISCISYFLYPLAVKYNTRTLTTFLNDFNVLSALCTIQIIESSAILLFGFKKDSEFNSNDREKPTFAPFPFPPVTLFVGIFCGEIVLVNRLHGISFHLVGLVFSFGLGLFFLVYGLGYLKIRKDSHWVLSCRAFISFIQILVAMFAPLIVQNLQIYSTHLHINMRNTVIALLGMTVIFMIGFVRTRFGRTTYRKNLTE